jgi:hypothetical protein
VNFNFNCTPLPGNIYSAELSDASGNFSLPTAIGSLAGTVPVRKYSVHHSQPHTFRISLSHSRSIISSAIIGNDNGTDLTITCPIPTGLSSSNITSISAKLSWNLVSCANKYQLQYRENNGAWQKTDVNSAIKTIDNLLPSTTYQWKVRSKCASAPNVYSAFSAVQTFSTNPLKVNENDEVTAVKLTAYPNPFTDETSHIIFNH